MSISCRGPRWIMDTVRFSLPRDVDDMSLGGSERPRSAFSKCTVDGCLVVPIVRQLPSALRFPCVAQYLISTAPLVRCVRPAPDHFLFPMTCVQLPLVSSCFYLRFPLW